MNLKGEMNINIVMQMMNNIWLCNGGVLSHEGLLC